MIHQVRVSCADCPQEIDHHVEMETQLLEMETDPLVMGIFPALERPAHETLVTSFAGNGHHVEKKNAPWATGHVERQSGDLQH